MKTHNLFVFCAALVVGVMLIAAPVTILAKASEKPSQGHELPKKGTSYPPVDLKEDLADVISRMKAAKPDIMKRQMELLKGTV